MRLRHVARRALARQSPGPGGQRHPHGTFSPKGRIDVAVVAKEIARLGRLWADGGAKGDGLERWISPETLAELDPFERVQLA